MAKELGLGRKAAIETSSVTPAPVQADQTTAVTPRPRQRNSWYDESCRCRECSGNSTDAGQEGETALWSSRWCSARAGFLTRF